MNFLKKIKNNLIINTRNFIFDLDKKNHFLGRPLKNLWSILCDIKFFLKKNFLKLSSCFRFGDLDFDKIFWIEPSKIKYYLITPNSEFGIWKNYGETLKGDWDKSVDKFENMDVYQALKHKFKNNGEWEETDFYGRVLDQISKGIRKWTCKSKEEFDKRLRKIESLYFEIKNNGYKTQKEIFDSKKIIDKIGRPGKMLDEITAALDRNGKLLLVEGRHRLSIAKLLNISKIPVKIIIRHKKWMDFRKELILFSKNYQKGQLYQPLTHPDLQDIPFRRDGEGRFKIIKENLTNKKGTMLDIGANLGYFCHKLEDEGFDCYALEENKMCVYFLNKIKNIEEKEFKIIPENLFEYGKKNILEFDVVLALSTFHHFLDREDTYLALVDFIKRLKVKELIFEPYLPEEFKGRNVYKFFNPEEFVDFIIKNSCCLRKAELIGHSEKRLIYKII